MVDRIASTQSQSVGDLSLAGLQSGQQVERTNKESAIVSSADVLALLDKADISEDALTRLGLERHASGFAILAQRSNEEFDSGKVNYFKSLLDSGKLDDYFGNVSNDDLAGSLLSSAPNALKLH